MVMLGCLFMFVSVLFQPFLQSRQFVVEVVEALQLQIVADTTPWSVRERERRKNKVFFMVLGAKIHQTSVAEFVLSLQSVAIKIGQKSGGGGEILPSRRRGGGEINAKATRRR